MINAKNDSENVINDQAMFTFGKWFNLNSKQYSDIKFEFVYLESKPQNEDYKGLSINEPKIKIKPVKGKFFL